jgi:uncharacterized protein YjbJ (UPF0337 family)
MNWEQIAGKWQQVKGIAQQKWSRLTGNYPGVVAGLRQRSLGSTRAGHAVRQQANEQQLAEWRERQHKVDPIHK